MCIHNDYSVGSVWNEQNQWDTGIMSGPVCGPIGVQWIGYPEQPSVETHGIRDTVSKLGLLVPG